MHAYAATVKQEKYAIQIVSVCRAQTQDPMPWSLSFPSSGSPHSNLTLLSQPLYPWCQLPCLKLEAFPVVSFHVQPLGKFLAMPAKCKASSTASFLHCSCGWCHQQPSARIETQPPGWAHSFYPCTLWKYFHQISRGDMVSHKVVNTTSPSQASSSLCCLIQLKSQRSAINLCVSDYQLHKVFSITDGSTSSLWWLWVPSHRWVISSKLSQPKA